MVAIPRRTSIRYKHDKNTFTLPEVLRQERRGIDFRQGKSKYFRFGLKPHAEYLNLKYLLLPCLKSLLSTTRLRRALIHVI